MLSRQDYNGARFRVNDDRREWEHSTVYANAGQRRYRSGGSLGAYYTSVRHPALLAFKHHSFCIDSTHDYQTQGTHNAKTYIDLVCPAERKNAT